MTTQPQGAQAGAVQVFNFQPQGAEAASIRGMMLNGEPWFVGRDVALALGYARPIDAITEYCKGVGDLPTPSAGGAQRTKIIPEADLYRLVLRSKMPAAEAFQDWICEEVLPALRRTGRYQIAAAGVAPSDIKIINAKIAQVRQAERLYGKEAARQLWVDLGLPPVAAPAAPPPPAADAWRACLRYMLRVDHGGTCVARLLETEGVEAEQRLKAFDVLVLPVNNSYGVSTLYLRVSERTCLFDGSSFSGSFIAVLLTMPGSLGTSEDPSLPSVSAYLPMETVSVEIAAVLADMTRGED